MEEKEELKPSVYIDKFIVESDFKFKIESPEIFEGFKKSLDAVGCKIPISPHSLKEGTEGELIFPLYFFYTNKTLFPCTNKREYVNTRVDEHSFDHFLNIIEWCFPSILIKLDQNNTFRRLIKEENVKLDVIKYNFNIPEESKARFKYIVETKRHLIEALNTLLKEEHSLICKF